MARPLPRRPVLRVLLAGAAVTLALLAWARPAGAHATLVAADPPDGARLDESPAEVRLTFSEHVSASLGGIQVVGADGQRVDRGAVRVTDDDVAVDLAPDLPEGTYVITYRIVSADGHPVRGSSLFGVGDAAVDTAVGDLLGGRGDDRRWEVVGGIGRGFAYAGTLLAAGGVAFLLLAARGGPERPLLVRVVRAAALAGGAGGLVALPVQAALGTGQGAGSLFDEGVLGAVLDDGVGLGLGLALGGLLVAMVALDRSRRMALAAAAVAAASFAATGHTRAGDTRWVATGADVVHLLVVAVWGGGLVLLALLLWSRRRGGAPATDTPAIVARFSTMATIAIVGAGAMGLLLGWSEVRSLDALTSTGYGQLLLVKAGVVAAVAALGAYNHFRLVPALAQGKTKAALAVLRRTLRLEALGLLVVVGLTSVLVVVTPARTDAGGGPVERIIDLGELGSAQLVVAPAKAGFNQIHLYTFDPAGRPAELAATIQLELSLPAAGIGPLERTATRAGPAHAQLNGDDFALAGRWEITVRVRADRFTEAAGTTEVQIAG
jgi:copper transport protein